MAETEATNQDGATPKPEATPETSQEFDARGRSGEQKSERQWLAERKEERRTAEKAIQTLKESPDQPKPEAEDQRATEEPPTETSQSESDDSTDAQTEDGGDAPEDTTQDEDYFPETLTEFAEAVGVKPEDFMQGVTATVKVNGEETSVPITDLLEAYASKSERDRLGVGLAEEKKAMEAASQQHQAEYQGRLQQVDDVLHALKASIDLGPSNQQLLQMLETGQIDQKGYQIEHAKREERIAYFNQAVNERNQFVQKQQEEAAQEFAKHRKEQQDGLLSWKPELRDPGKLAAYQTRLHSSLKDNYGFTDADVERFFGNYTLRELKVVEDAIAHRELKAKEKPLRDKLHRLPKLQKPGPKRSEAQRANDKVLGARNRLRAAQSEEAGVGLLREQRLANQGTRRYGRSK